MKTFLWLLLGFMIAFIGFKIYEHQEKREEILLTETIKEREERVVNEELRWQQYFENFKDLQNKTLWLPIVISVLFLIRSFIKLRDPLTNPMEEIPRILIFFAGILVIYYCSIWGVSMYTTILSS